MANSKKRCKQCDEYQPVETMQKYPAGIFCNDTCRKAFTDAAWQRAQQKKAVKAKKDKAEADKAFRRETVARKEALKSRGDHMKAAQREFNRFIRMRDHGCSCISCGRNTGSKINAGHYKSVGAHPELRFNELNCNLQCEHCNTHLSSNQAGYRPALIEKIGWGKVEWIEGPHEPAKLTIDDIKEIRTKYRLRANILEIELGLK